MWLWMRRDSIGLRRRHGPSESVSNPSPFGRRWREAPDEGAPSPAAFAAPSPRGRGNYLLFALRNVRRTGNRTIQAQKESSAIRQNEVSSDCFIRSFFRLIAFDRQFGADL